MMIVVLVISSNVEIIIVICVIQKRRNELSHHDIFRSECGDFEGGFVDGELDQPVHDGVRVLVVRDDLPDSDEHGTEDR